MSSILAFVPSRAAAHTLAALLLSGALVACSDDDTAPEPGTDVAEGDADVDETDTTEDPCADVDCSELTTDCSIGSCDPTSGDCLTVPFNEGAPCDDGDEETSNDMCVVGVCEGSR